MPCTPLGMVFGRRVHTHTHTWIDDHERRSGKAFLYPAEPGDDAARVAEANGMENSASWLEAARGKVGTKYPRE